MANQQEDLLARELGKLGSLGGKIGGGAAGEGRYAVKGKRFSVEQIVGVLKRAEVGVSVGELLRKVGISKQTFYRWKKKYVDLPNLDVVEFTYDLSPNFGGFRFLQ